MSADRQPRIPDVAAWIDDLVARHTRAMTRAEFLKAVRALSVRYVERRSTLRDRSPIDSAGKRAAFAAFYAPLHFLTTRAIVQRLGAGSAVTGVLDLGCGTGVASAAWAIDQNPTPAITGVDVNAWSLIEARYTWRSLGLHAQGMRGNLVTTLDRWSPPASKDARVGIIAGWSLNELESRDRKRVLTRLMDFGVRGVPVLVIEPIAKTAAPWWDEFADDATAAGARADDWRVSIELPPLFAGLSRDAGFDRRALTARSVAFGFQS